LKLDDTEDAVVSRLRSRASLRLHPRTPHGFGPGAQRRLRIEREFAGTEDAAVG
jgi:hypothetical protein